MSGVSWSALSGMQVRDVLRCVFSVGLLLVCMGAITARTVHPPAGRRIRSAHGCLGCAGRRYARHVRRHVHPTRPPQLELRSRPLAGPAPFLTQARGRRRARPQAPCSRAPARRSASAVASSRYRAPRASNGRKGCASRGAAAGATGKTEAGEHVGLVGAVDRRPRRNGERPLSEPAGSRSDLHALRKPSRGDDERAAPGVRPSTRRSGAVRTPGRRCRA